jgi:hypothetical protein
MFFDRLYATLTAWGMHRMGKGNTRLTDLKIIQDSFLHQDANIREVEELRIEDLNPRDVAEVTRKLWVILDGLKVGVQKRKIVINTKALHHLLPDLVPPIDGEYTIRFFYGNKNANKRDDVIFKDVYPLFYKIAVAHKENITRWVSETAVMNTSTTKVIDNAIVGYGIMVLRPQKQKAVSKPAAEYHVQEPISDIPKALTARNDLPHHEKIMYAVANIVQGQGIDTFSRDDIRRQLGLSPEDWLNGYTRVFQDMRADKPGGAPNVNKKFQDVFKRVERGLYRLTEYGKTILKEFWKKRLL